MNLNRVILDIHGRPGKKSFPRDAEDAKEVETVKNVVLNAMAIYPIKERVDVFSLHSIAAAILRVTDGDFSLVSFPDSRKLLTEVMYEATFREQKDGSIKGVYLAHVTSQILEEINK